MKNSNIESATEKCENYLRVKKSDNLDNRIYPSENIVIDILLKSSRSMSATYEELVKLFTEQQYKEIIDSILYAVVYWNPDKAQEYRKGRRDLQDVNKRISKSALKLSKALAEREEMEGMLGFYSDTHSCIGEIIDKASYNNGHYHPLKKELKRLFVSFDDKYWPSLSDIISAIGQDANNPKIEATDPLTRAATNSQRPSKSDFLKVLLTSLYGKQQSIIPRSTKISDKSLADIVNCVLELENDIVDSIFIKGVRQRLRNNKKD